jgi:hypothetical protein
MPAQACINVLPNGTNHSSSTSLHLARFVSLWGLHFYAKKLTFNMTNISKCPGSQQDPFKKLILKGRWELAGRETGCAPCKVSSKSVASKKKSKWHQQVERWTWTGADSGGFVYWLASQYFLLWHCKDELLHRRTIAVISKAKEQIFIKCLLCTKRYYKSLLVLFLSPLQYPMK